MTTSSASPFGNPIHRLGHRRDKLHGIAELYGSQNFHIAGLPTASLLSQIPKPLRPFAEQVESIRVTSGQPLPIRLTNQTTARILGVTVPVGFGRIDFQNTFVAEAYNKSLLRGLKLSLASFATVSLYPFESTLQLDKIVTNGQTITAVATVRYHNAIIGGKTSDLTISQAFLFAEGSRYLYEVEVEYSTATHEATARWSDLQQMLESFRVVG